MGESLDADNRAVADALERYASLLDLAGSSYYVVRAYRRAAELIRPLATPVTELVRTGRVRELRGIGPGLETRLREAVESGRLQDVPGMGPKTAAKLREALKSEAEPRARLGLTLNRARDL